MMTYVSGVALGRLRTLVLDPKPQAPMQNVGGIDRVLRVLVGIVLIALVFVGPKTNWGYIGIVPLLTGVFSFCPLYTALGIKTCKQAE